MKYRKEWLKKIAKVTHVLLVTVFIIGLGSWGPISYAASGTITTMSPTSGTTSGGTSVTLTGTNLNPSNAIVNAVSVIIDGITVSPTFSGPSTVTFDTPPHASSPGGVTVVVKILSTSQLITVPQKFYYVGGSPPSINTITPTNGIITGGTTVTITGTALSGATVKFGGTPGTITSTSATTVVVKTPPHAAAYVDVEVTTMFTPSAIKSSGFLYVPLPVQPTINTVNPNSGSAGGGTKLDINGSNFQYGAVVSIGGTPGIGGSITATQIHNVVTPPHAAGKVDVTVTNPNAPAATVLNGFTYTATIPPPSSLSTPTGLALAAVVKDNQDPTKYNFIIAWDKVTNATGYEIERTQIPNGPVVTSAYNMATFSKMAPGTYYYVVRATNGSDKSNNSTELQVVIADSATSINNLSVDKNPYDPAKGSLTLSYTLSGSSGTNKIEVGVGSVTTKQQKTFSFSNIQNGPQTIMWDGKDDANATATNGDYIFVVSVTENGQLTQKNVPFAVGADGTPPGGGGGAVCGNGACESGEDASSCPNDCSSGAMNNSNFGNNNSSGSGTLTDTGTGNTSGSQTGTVNLKPADDILSCQEVKPNVILSTYSSAVIRCKLQKPPYYVTAKIVKGDYTPPNDPDPSAVAKTVLNNKQISLQVLSLTWNGIDDYDQPAAEGDYTFVVSATPDSGTAPDISIQKIHVMQNPPVQTQEASATQPGGQSSKPKAPKPAPKPPEPSKCPGVNYPIDIDGHWAKDFIRLGYDLCVFRGYKDGSFHPDGKISRAEAVKAALVAAGIGPKYGCWDTDCGSPFFDLVMWQGQWLRPAADLKIVKGVAEHAFAPERSITRGEGSVLIAKAFHLKPFDAKLCWSPNCGAGYPNNFFIDITDKTQGSYLRALWDKGIIKGTGPNAFDPNRPMTRGEFAALLMKTGEVLGKIKASTPPAPAPAPAPAPTQQTAPTQETLQTLQ